MREQRLCVGKKYCGYYQYESKFITAARVVFVHTDTLQNLEMIAHIHTCYEQLACMCTQNAIL